MAISLPGSEQSVPAGARLHSKLPSVAARVDANVSAGQRQSRDETAAVIELLADGQLRHASCEAPPETGLYELSRHSIRVPEMQK